MELTHPMGNATTGRKSRSDDDSSSCIRQRRKLSRRKNRWEVVKTEWRPQKHGDSSIQRQYALLRCPWCAALVEVAANRTDALHSTVTREHLAVRCRVYDGPRIKSRKERERERQQRRVEELVELRMEALVAKEAAPKPSTEPRSRPPRCTVVDDDAGGAETTL